MKRHGLGTPEVAGAADLEYLGVTKGIVAERLRRNILFGG